MQLKRETDYAIRVMICIAEALKDRGEEAGVSASEIIGRTQIPRVSFYRICSYLEESQLIVKKGGKNREVLFYPGELFWEQSLLSVAEAVEGNMRIFVLFGRNTSLLKKYAPVVRTVQNEIDAALSAVTMESIVNQKEHAQ